jgi:hypothetical protein
MLDENENLDDLEDKETEEELENLIGGTQNDNIRELHQYLKAATTVYIDNRCIGNYLEGNARNYGSMAGKDIIGSVTDEEVAGQVLVENVDKIRSVYVRTANYDRAQQILKDKHLLILWGDRNFGKQTTGIHLLSSLSNNEILEVNPAIEELSLFECETQQAYIIDTLASNSAEKLSFYVMNVLSKKLVNQNSYLVITIDSRTSIDRYELHSYLTHYDDFPPSNLLLEKHLVWYTKKQVVLADDKYSLAQKDVLQKILTSKLLPGQLDRLAVLLAKVAGAELTFEEALARFSLLADDHIERWFGNNPSLAQVTLMISLAVLNKSKYQTVLNASKSLQFIIQSLSEDASNSESVFSTRLSQQLKEVSAHLVQGYKITKLRRDPVELIEFDNPSLQPAVLSYVWQEYHTVRQPLLKWLYELGLDKDLDVQVKVAAAVGELSKYDFGFICEQILLPWANCKKRHLQKLAALSLGIPIFESELAPQVLTLLHQWSTLKNNIYLRWTAATAYGGYVGLRFPSTALRDLLAIAKGGSSTIAQPGDLQFLPAVTSSVVNIFEAGRVLSVLKALKAWSNCSQTKLSHQLGLFIFWMLMRSNKAIANSSTPALLELAKQDRVYENLVICLLQRSLDIKYLSIIREFRLRDRVEQEIYNWLKQVDEDPKHELYSTIGQIIFALAVQGTKQEQGRILARLEGWKSNQKSNAARKILGKIKNHFHI